MKSHPSYELLEELGRGQNSIVFRGYDLNLQREVAIKQITRPDSSDHADSEREAQAISRILRSAAFLAQFQHEHMLRIHSVEKAQGWIVMELMQGTLAGQIANNAMSPDTVRSVLRQILSALAFLHGEGKVHGSIRPSNILVNAQGTVKLSDFDETSHDGELRVPMGSKKYLAPELVVPKFGEFGPQVDLYCLGFTALELVMGPDFDALFPGTQDDAVDADVAWIRWHSSDEPLKPISDINPAIPPDLAAAIETLVAKNCQQRASDANEVLALLNSGPDIPVTVSQDKTNKDASRALTEPVPPNPNLRKKVLPATKQQPATRKGVNAFLGKPFVLWPICVAIMVGAAMLGTKLRAARVTEPSEFVVEFQILPAPQGVTLSIDGKPIDIQQSYSVRVAGGSHEVIATRPGFDRYESTFHVAGDTTHKITLSKTPPTESTPVEPQPQFVELQLKVTPPDAELWIDGQKFSSVAGTLKLKREANRGLQLSVIHDGYKPLSKVWSAEELEANQFVLSVGLTPTKPTPPPMAKVKLGLQPTEAIVLFDGAVVPNSEHVYTLNPGTYELTVTKKGYRPYAQKVMLGPGESSLQVALEKLPPPPPKVAKVRLKITPANAIVQVKFNGRLYRPNADGVFVLPPEYYQLMVISKGYQTFRMSTHIAAGKIEFPIHLQRIPKPRPALMRLVTVSKTKVTSVKIDGKEARRNKDGLYELKPGKHRIWVDAKDDYRGWRDVNLPSGESLITIELTKKPPMFLYSGDSKKKKGK